MLVNMDYTGPLETGRRASLTPQLEGTLGITVKPGLPNGRLTKVPQPFPLPRDTLGMVLPQYYSQHLCGVLQPAPAGAVREADEEPMEMEPDPRIFDWDFDLIAYTSDSPHKALATIGYPILTSFHVARVLRIPANEAPDLIRNWLGLIETIYHRNVPYHNNVHAADVLQATAFLVGDETLRSHLTELDVAAVLLSAALHDVDHPGVSSQFLINKKHDLAVLYNDVSVLENHHLSLAFHLTTKLRMDCNLFKYLTHDEYKLFRSKVIAIVLATDMARHREIMDKYRLAAEANSIDASLICQLVIKVADISNPARPWHLCVTWAERLFTEFSAQWRREKDNCLPETMGFFKTHDNLPLCQIGFIDAFARDVLHQLAVVCPRVREPKGPLFHLESNYKSWTDAKTASSQL